MSEEIETNNRKVAKLNQVVAVEKGVKARETAVISELYKTVQKPNLFNGFSKKYKPKEEDGESKPPESMNVQETVTDLLIRVTASKSELFDVTAQKDSANMTAMANVVVDGVVVGNNFPVPYLIFLEKQLVELRTFFGALPVLDANEEWTKDPNSDLYKSSPVETISTRKEQVPVVLYDATDKHPAQTQLITKDVTAGVYETIKHSGAIAKPEKAKLMEKVDKLLKAVKYAREEANLFDAPKIGVGSAVFGYLLG